MNDHIFYQANPETRNTAPVQFFEAAAGPPPADAKGTPRPADRPRELPPEVPGSATFQLFECEAEAGAQGAKATPRPTGREREG